MHLVVAADYSEEPAGVHRTAMALAVVGPYPVERMLQTAEAMVWWVPAELVLEVMRVEFLVLPDQRMAVLIHRPVVTSLSRVQLLGEPMVQEALAELVEMSRLQREQ